MDKVKELTAKVPQFVSDVEVEMKRISWPLMKETVRSTGAVIFISIILASFLGFVDFIFSLIVRSILS